MNVGSVLVPLIGCEPVVLNVNYLVMGQRLFNITDLTRYVFRRINLTDRISFSLGKEDLCECIRWNTSYLLGRNHFIATYLGDFIEGETYNHDEILKSSYVSFDSFCMSIEEMALTYPEDSSFQCILEFLYQKDYIETIINK